MPDSQTYRLTLNFHGLGEPGRGLDPDEAEYWLDTDAFLEMIDFVQGHPMVRATFDDGNSSDVELALPALCRRGMRAEFFLLAGKIGAPGYVSEGQVEELVKAKMGIGLHGMDHFSWRGADQPTLDREIVDARRRLEQLVKAPIVRAACPFGEYDRRSLAILREQGFERVYTSDDGIARPHEWLQCRTTVTREHGPRDLDRWLRLSPWGFTDVQQRVRTMVKRFR